MAMKRVYLALAIVGTIVPWAFFIVFFAEHGVDLALFVRSVFDNAAAAGFAADIIISIVVFLIWSWRDARVRGITRWWLVLPATCLVGLSLSLPLYLYLREGTECE